MILGDPSHTEYDEMDYKLVKAYYLKQGYMSGNFPVWIDQSDRVTFEVKSYTSKSESAIEKAQRANDKNEPGKKYYAVPKTIDGGPMPTMNDYLEQQEKVTATKSKPVVDNMRDVDLPIQGLD